LTGGTTAIFAAMILGPRRGRFHDDMGRKLDKPRQFIGHSTALQVRLCCNGIGINDLAL
jgi:Amt family ammonium transporter